MFGQRVALAAAVVALTAVVALVVPAVSFAIDYADGNGNACEGPNCAAWAGSIGGLSIAGPTQPVLVNASGQLGTATASAALKTDIRPLNPGRLLDLRPVSYRYKAAYAPLGDTGTQYGLIAEQVARTLPQLVQRDPLGRPTGMHYDQLPVLLLAQLQRQHQRLHFQGGRLARQQNEIDALKRQNQRLAHQQAHIQLLIRRARHH